MLQMEDYFAKGYLKIYGYNLPLEMQVERSVLLMLSGTSAKKRKDGLESGRIQ